MEKKSGLRLPLKRGSSDDFQTPCEDNPWIAESVLQFIPEKAVIWEPSCGKGQLANAFREYGNKVIATDINVGKDFLAFDKPPKGVTHIITNPPFSIKDSFLEKVISFGLPWAFLVNITTLGEQKRVRLYKKIGGIEYIFLPKRINYDTPSGKLSSAHFYSLWIGKGILPTGKTVEWITDEDIDSDGSLV